MYLRLMLEAHDGALASYFFQGDRVPAKKMLALIKLAVNRLDGQQVWQQYLDGLTEEQRAGEAPLPIPGWVFAQCQNCQDNFIPREDGASDRYCSECIQHYGICQSCGTYLMMTVDDYENAEADVPSHQMDHLCSSCFMVRAREMEGRRSPWRRMNNYSTRPMVALNNNSWMDEDPESKAKVRAETVKYGVELELYFEDATWDAANDLAADVTETLQGRGIVKEDGSLNERGFEICTVPLTLEQHRGLWPEAVQRPVWRELREDSHAGLHIHNTLYRSTDDYAPPDGTASNSRRRYLVKLEDAAKYIQFINCGLNQRWVWAMAGRGANSYVGYRPFLNYRNAMALTKMSSDYWPVDDAGVSKGRYSAVGMPTKHPTMETRIFDSTTDADVVVARVEMVAALLEWCKEAEPRDLWWDNFHEWAKAHEGKYPLLCWQMQERVRPDVVAMATFGDKSREDFVKNATMRDYSFTAEVLGELPAPGSILQVQTVPQPHYISTPSRS